MASSTVAMLSVKCRPRATSRPSWPDTSRAASPAPRASAPSPPTPVSARPPALLLLLGSIFWCSWPWRRTIRKREPRELAPAPELALELALALELELEPELELELEPAPASLSAPLAASTCSSVAVLPEPRWPARSTTSFEASSSERSSTRASCKACSSTPHSGAALDSFRTSSALSTPSSAARSAAAANAASSDESWRARLAGGGPPSPWSMDASLLPRPVNLEITAKDRQSVSSTRWGANTGVARAPRRVRVTVAGAEAGVGAKRPEPLA